MSETDHQNNIDSSQQQTSIEQQTSGTHEKQNQIPSITLKLIDKLNQYQQDYQQLTLEDSIPILYEINIFQELTSIPEAKIRLANENKPNARLQLQARFIYNLWKLIDTETIQFKEFKQTIMLFMTCSFQDLMRSLQQSFEESQDTIVQLMAIWEAMIQEALQSRSRKNSKYNCQQFALSESNFKNLNINQTQNVNNHSNKNSFLSSNNKRAGSSGYSKNVVQKQNYQRPSPNNLNSERSRMSSQNMKPRNFTERDHYSNRNSTASKQNEEQNYGTYYYEVPVMSVQKQKQLVERLYKVDKYEHFKELKKIQDAQKMQKQLEQCTFRPNITKKRANSRVDSHRPSQQASKKIGNTKNKAIPGFQKAIKRMKQGQQKSKQLKEQLELRNIVIKNYTQQERRIVPPKFLNRTNKEGKVCLFTINFQIGKHKLATRVHQDDTAQKIARNIQSIYSLKQESYEQIRSIIQQQIQKNYLLKQKQERQKPTSNEKYQNNNDHHQFEEQFNYQNTLMPQNSTEVLQGYIY